MSKTNYRCGYKLADQVNRARLYFGFPAHEEKQR